MFFAPFCGHINVRCSLVFFQSNPQPNFYETSFILTGFTGLSGFFGFSRSNILSIRPVPLKAGLILSENLNFISLSFLFDQTGCRRCANDFSPRYSKFLVHYSIFCSQISDHQQSVASTSSRGLPHTPALLVIADLDRSFR